MFSKSIHLAFVLLALSGLTAHAAPRPSAEDCPSAVVTSTVTLSSRNASPTGNNAAGSKAAGTSSSNGSGKQSGSSSQTKGGKGPAGKFGGSGSKSGNNNAGSSSSAVSSTTTTSAAESTTTSANNNGGNSAAGSGSVNSGSGNNGNSTNSDFNTSLQLDPRVICNGFKQDGQGAAQNPQPGQVASRTSSNNFINDCLNSPNLPLTDGKQIAAGSCNPAPIGVIPSTDHMPTQKFQQPKNLDTIQANADFKVTLRINNLDSGNFVNAKTNYFAAPQSVSSDGKIIGHTHIVIEQVESLTSTTLTDASTFSFFQGINNAADGNGDVTVDVSKGVPSGAYRMCTIVTSANHVPAIGPVAQHGSFEDCIYFTASDNGSAVGSNSTASAASGSAASGSAASTTAAASGSESTSSASTSAAGAKSTSTTTGKNSNQNGGNTKGNTSNGNKNQQQKGGNTNKFGGKFGGK